MAKKRATAPELTQATYVVARYKTTRWGAYLRGNGIDTRVAAISPQASKRDAYARLMEYIAALTPAPLHDGEGLGVG